MSSAQVKINMDLAKLSAMLGSNQYESPYSFVQELCQNAEDSHRMSKQDKNYDVGFKRVIGIKTEQPHSFYVRDYGNSFVSKEDFVDKVCTLLASGKVQDKTNEEDIPMGKWGIGSISPARYLKSSSVTRKFYYKVYKDGKMFTATLEEVEQKGLMYEISDFSNTTEPDGVEVIVPYNSREGGYNSFIENIEKRLCYFQNINFTADSDFVKNVCSSFAQTAVKYNRILRDDDYQISSLSKRNTLHIVLDQYVYDIDWQELKLSQIPGNLALRFKMNDGLEPNATRERLFINENYTKILTDKIAKIATKLLERKISEHDGCANSIINGINYVKTKSSLKIYDYYYDLSYFHKFTKVTLPEVTFKNFSKRIIHKFIISADYLDFYSLVYSFRNGTRRTMYHTMNYDKKFLYDERRILKHESNYLRIFECGLYKRKTIADEYLINFYGSTPNLTLQDCRKEFEAMLDEVDKEMFTKLDSLNLIKPEVKKKERKKKASIEKLEGEVIFREAVPMTNNSYNFNCKFDKLKAVQIKDLSTIRKIVVYGLETERSYLETAYSKISSKFNIQVIMLNKTDYKIVKKMEIENFKEVKDFLTSRHKFIIKAVTSKKVRDFLNSSSTSSFNYYFDLIKTYFSDELIQDWQELNDYVKHDFNERNGELFKECEKMIEDLKLYDYTVFEKIERIKSNLNKYEFISYFYHDLKNPKNKSHDLSKKILIDYSKFNKLRLKDEYYSKK